MFKRESPGVEDTYTKGGEGNGRTGWKGRLALDAVVGKLIWQLARVQGRRISCVTYYEPS